MSAFPLLPLVVCPAPGAAFRALAENFVCLRTALGFSTQSPKPKASRLPPLAAMSKNPAGPHPAAAPVSRHHPSPFPLSRFLAFSISAFPLSRFLDFRFSPQTFLYYTIPSACQPPG